MVRHRRKSGFFSKVGVGKSDGIIQLDAMIYGGVRQWASQAIAPLTSKIPLVGNLSDEVGMGFIDYMLAKHTKGLVADVAKKGLVIENARVGEAIAGGFMGGSVGGSGGLAPYDSGFSY